MAKNHRNKRPRGRKRRGTGPMLSLCMIVRNEEPWLGRCLESVRDIVDEIVVVDTGSTDGTVDVARRYGARLFFEEWRGDFSAARNRSLREATGDWILVLDADEVIPREVVGRLRRAVDRPRADAYRMVTRNYRHDPAAYGCQPTRGDFKEEEEAGYPYWVPTTKIRLFRRLLGVEFRGAVHELVEESVSELGLKIADLDVPVLHFGDVEKERTPDRYLDVAEKKVRERPEDPLAFQELAIVQERMGKNKEAIQSCDRALQLLAEGKSSPYATTEILYSVKGKALQNLGNYEEAAACYMDGLKRNPGSHELANNLGVCYECLGEYESAAKWYSRAVELRPELPLARENLKRVRRKLRRERTLSVCMIVRNGAKTLRRALESASHFADEIVVVDTGSTDDTIAIAESFGAKIGHFDWCDDFAAARNASLELATGDWIMWLDADDYVPPTEWPKLQEIKFQSLDQAFMFLLRNEGVAKETCWQIRMFPNRPQLRFRYPVHEQIAPALVEHGYAIRTANITVVHTGYTSGEVVSQKREKYLRTLLRHLDRYPDDVISHYHVGFTFHSTGRQEKAIEHLRKVVENAECKRKHPATYANAWVYLGRSYLALNRLDEAEGAFREALKLDRKSALARVSLAQLYNLRDEPERALQELEELASLGLSPSTMPVDLEALLYAAAYQRGLSLEKLGRMREALQTYIEAQKQVPRFRMAANRAAVLLGKIKDESIVNETVRVLEGSARSATELFELGTALVHAAKPDAAERVLRLALEREPGHEKARRALAAILRRTGREEEAIRTLREGLTAGGGSGEVLASLLDLLFASGRWNEILECEQDEAWPARVAVRMLNGDVDGLLRELACHPDLFPPGQEVTVEAVWAAARQVPPAFRFFLAEACSAVEPTQREALEQAIRGWLERGEPQKALERAELYVRTFPSERGAYQLLAECYRRMGVNAAAELCEQKIEELGAAPVG